MKRVFVIVLFLLSFSAWSQVVISPKDKATTVYPGDVAEATAQILDESLINSLKPQVWRKMGTTQTFLFMGISPMEKDGSGWHVSLKMVLGPNFSPDKSYTLELANRVIEVTFQGWMWNPQGQQIAPEFDYEDVPLFSRTWFRRNWPITISLALVLSGFIGLLVRHVLRLRKIKKEKAAEIAAWLQKVASANSVHELSLIWAKRDDLSRIFPECAEELRHFFDRLNMSQFKPSVSKDELDALLTARNLLLEKLRRRGHGA